MLPQYEPTSLCGALECVPRVIPSGMNEWISKRVVRRESNVNALRNSLPLDGARERNGNLRFLAFNRNIFDKLIFCKLCSLLKIDRALQMLCYIIFATFIRKRGSRYNNNEAIVIGCVCEITKFFLLRKRNREAAHNNHQ